MDHQIVLKVCPNCGEGFSAASGRRGRPAVWCSTDCRRESSARRVAAEKGRGAAVKVLTVATEKTRYTSVPLRELTRAITENPALAVELAEKLQQIAETSYNFDTQKAIMDALSAAGIASARHLERELSHREKALDRQREILDQRELLFDEKEKNRTTTVYEPGASFFR